MLISVPATSANLGPGFDSLGLSIDLRNEILIKPSNFLSLSTNGEGSGNIKIRKNQLFLDIFGTHYKRLSGKEDNFRFEFLNRIPISRGLGSSSAVIVAAIASAYVAAGVHYTKREILNLALTYEKHPDNITPAVMGGFNVACVEDDKVYSKKRRLPDYLRAVLVVPNRTISTAKSRTTLPKVYSKEETIYSLSRSAYMTALFMTESWDLLRIASKDKLHQTRRMKMMPELFDVQKIALSNGALMSTLSGSGSTFFSLCYQDDSQKLSQALENKFTGFRVMTCNLDNNGVLVKS
ncbi:Homoserine kinase [Sulfurovum sp. enrichment culture clone C5]|uniref:Homoserine kinase n=1 Tax=Sulfurovum sp. enrichment culture clone C5 TaxID=497650 RepID=A0A0S4XQT6_9BACT|nr:Homoserine kinase [Sulfurovum sp. enrichment culture clone C5]